MQGRIEKRGKAWFFTTFFAGKTFTYRLNRVAEGPSLKIRTGPAEAGIGFGQHGSAVVYQKGRVVGDFSIHAPAERDFKGLGMASGLYLHLAVRGAFVKWVITTSSGETVDSGVLTGQTADEATAAPSAAQAAEAFRRARRTLLNPAEYGISSTLYWGWLDWNGRKVRLAASQLNGPEGWDIEGGGMENAHTFVLKPGTVRSNSWSFQDATNVDPIRLHAIPREEWPRNSKNDSIPILRVEPFAMQGRTQRAEVHKAFVSINGARKLLVSDRALVVVWNEGRSLARLYVTKSMADALSVWLDSVEDRGLAGTMAEHSTDFQNARQELMEAVNDAREAMSNGQCLVAGKRIDDGYVAYGRLQANAYDGKDISEASRLLRELKAADEPFEKKCVRTEPQSETHERSMRMMRPGLAGRR